jgi:hypothetical protein
LVRCHCLRWERSGFSACCCVCLWDRRKPPRAPSWAAWPHRPGLVNCSASTPLIGLLIFIFGGQVMAIPGIAIVLTLGLVLLLVKVHDPSGPAKMHEHSTAR